MHGHLDSVRALVHGLAGETGKAERVFAAVQAQAANGRRRAATYAHQALAYAKTADPEAACAALREAITLATSDHYAMGLNRAVGVRHGFDHRWSNLPCVQDLDEQLHHLAMVR